MGIHYVIQHQTSMWLKAVSTVILTCDTCPLVILGVAPAEFMLVLAEGGVVRFWVGVVAIWALWGEVFVTPDKGGVTAGGRAGSGLVGGLFFLSLTDSGKGPGHSSTSPDCSKAWFTLRPSGRVISTETVSWLRSLITAGQQPTSSPNSSYKRK